MPRIRVLIADDELVVRESLAALVDADPSMEVVGVAANVDETGQIARDRHPDVAVLDVRMPGGGGAAAAAMIRRLSPDTRILALSAYEDRATVLQMLRAGAVGYLVKGNPALEILESIRRSFLGYGTLSPEVATKVVDELATQLEREARGAEEHALCARRIQRILDGEGMTMVFQPIADLRHGEVVGVEALARFSSEPQQGPDRWFEDATQVGLRVELEIAAVRAAIASIDDLPSGAYLSVNLSPETILAPAFVGFVHEAPCQRLVVEVTEHAPVEDYEQLRVALADYRASGGRLAVDDAGAGFASLRHILRLAPDIIKLDVSLTRGIDSDQASQALADALASFAGRIGATIVAEGIETIDELGALHALGITHGQGYFLCRPTTVPLAFQIVPSLASAA